MKNKSTYLCEKRQELENEIKTHPEKQKVTKWEGERKKEN